MRRGKAPGQGQLGKTMKSIEVNEKKWAQFCRSVDEYCRGAMVTIKLEEGSGVKTVIVENAALRHMAFDAHAEACNSNLVIEAGGQASKELRHIVVGPVHTP